MTTTTSAAEAAPPAEAPPMSKTQYLGYAGGDAANNLTFTLVSMFLLIYYTDVAGIAAGTAGTILLVARVWAAFADVFAGRMVDKTTTRWGRFRPYFPTAGALVMLLSIATFSIPGALSSGATLLYAYASYLLFQLAYSFVNIPYGSLASAMTQLPDERAKLSSARSLGTALAIILLTVAVSPQIKSSKDLQSSLTRTTVIFAVIGYVLYLFLFKTSRESVARDAAPVSLKQSIGSVRQNRPLMLLCLSALLLLSGMFTMQTLQVYYARDVLGNANYLILLTVLTTGAMFLIAPALPSIVNAFGKKRAYLVGGVVTVVGGVGIGLTPPSYTVLTFFCFLVYGCGISAVQGLMWALQSDTVEYGEWGSGVRTEGTNYAALSFVRKVGQGIGGAVAAYGIGLGGYVGGAPAQSSEALDTIRYLTGFGAAALVAIGTAVMLRYPLTEDKFRDVVGELAARRADGK